MKEWKASAKEAQKMTRDGAVSVNLVTGETTYPSDRTPEQDHSASGDTAGAAGKVVDRAELHREQAAAKKKRRKQRRAYREGEAAASRPSSRLQFSEADRTVPELQGAIRKSGNAGAGKVYPKIGQSSRPAGRGKGCCSVQTAIPPAYQSAVPPHPGGRRRHPQKSPGGGAGKFRRPVGPPGRTRY